ncbi:hypothetical protein IV203_032623 [Nitzschia inconspicua]|uniref:DUF6570 domain-containing protein n=2 Tax=Nitzschia inconspicua TaxID=303405 RepID=A0A9K3KJY4_9STRA|nr:hypothetical protein IV203_032623 [Nitzschia inconspicua]
MHIPTIETVKKAAVGAVRDRNNLTFYDDTSATYKTKVCAICDRFILHGKECKITLEALQDKKVKELLSKKSLKWNSDVPSNVKLSLTKYYTCKAFDTGIGSTRWIREYVLSSRAFRAKAGKKDAPRAFRAKAGKKDAVGSCKLCAYEIKKARRGDTVAPSLPTYSIANGLMIGKAPLELTRLNDVEKALIARARIDKHIFSFEAGSHKSTKGWHTMFYNEVNAVLGVSNWSESVMRLNDSNSDSDSESTDNMHPETRDGKVVQVRKRAYLRSALFWLCAIDFENVIGITVEHILGWDLNKNINKPGYGFFGDLDGRTFAVEEQGRKTLHAHFLLWIKGWGKLRSGLGTAKGHEEYVKQVSKYGDRVMCTRLHGFSSRLVPKVCHNDCSNTGEGTEGYQKCTTQDLRQLQTKQGETSLGAKKILFCSVCKASLSSEDVTLQRLKKYYGDALAGEDENFWLSSRYLTKCCVLMEMEVLHSMLPPKYAYVNVHSEFASILFGCNTNVITGVDGGSVMYCTCYVSKNTEKEDNKHFADAAKHMVKNMQQQMAERKELLDLELEEEASSVGLKGMIGAALMATKVHKVAAPMASYLIRNGSRFHFSHNFSYVDIGSFFKAIQEDLNISADEDGSVFLKSSVSNYLCRPKELEEVCVYDFESQ